MPKKKFVKQTPSEWKIIAKKIGFNDEQTTAVVNLMQFIRETNTVFDEMDDDKENLLVISKTFNFIRITNLTQFLGGKMCKTS